MYEVVKSELDLYNNVPVQTSVESSKWICYQPVSSLQGSGNVEFFVPGNGEEFIDPSLTMLYAKVKILLLDTGGNILAVDDVGPVNNFAHSIWDTAEVSANDTIISPSTGNYAFRSHIETLLNYGPAAKNSHLGCALWFKDTAGHMDSLTANKGYLERKAFTTLSKEVELYVPLFLDLFNVTKYLPNGVNLRIKLSRNKAAFSLLGAAPAVGGGYKLEVSDVGLYVRKVRVAPKIMLALESAWNKGTAKYPYTRTEIKVFTISPNIQNTTIDNVFLGVLPTRVILGLVSHKAYNGSLELNPFNYKHYDLNYLSLFVDSEQIPAKPLRPNFDKDLYVRSYYSLFSGSGTHYKDDGNDISIKDYPKGYTLFAFDLSQDGSASDINHYNPIRQGQLRLELGFAKAVPETLSCIVLSEFQSLIQIDKNRNVVVDAQ